LYCAGLDVQIYFLRFSFFFQHFLYSVTLTFLPEVPPSSHVMGTGTGILFTLPALAIIVNNLLVAFAGER
jgi:hypothetical protein